jgi:hypothetical protein
MKQKLSLVEGVERHQFIFELRELPKYAPFLRVGKPPDDSVRVFPLLLSASHGQLGLPPHSMLFTPYHPRTCCNRKSSQSAFRRRPSSLLSAQAKIPARKSANLHRDTYRTLVPSLASTKPCHAHVSQLMPCQSRRLLLFLVLMVIAGQGSTDVTNVRSPLAGI